MSVFERYAKQRVTRRRALAAAGLSASAAAFLAACGGGSGSSGGNQTSTGLLSIPQNTAAKAKTGGTLKSVTGGADVNSWDVAAARSGPETGPGSFTYPRLVKFKAPAYPALSDESVEGDAAESFEVSADKLQVTMKVRPGMHWDAKAPTSGRLIDATDVVATWGRFSTLSTLRGALIYSSGNPDAPVESISSPDSQTVVFKLHKPNSVVLQLFAQSQGFLVMPKEADGGFNPKTDVRGYGPYLLSQYTPSAIYVWQRNPDYYVQGRPYIDTIEQPFLSDYSTQLAQFKAGNIYNNVITLRDDFIPTKQANPDLVLQQSTKHSFSSDSHLTFGYEGDSPFKDQRVRQAISYLIDRDSYVDAVTNSDKFAAAGIAIDVRFPAPIPQGFDGYWLDPKGKDFGPNAKYLNFDLAEAKKLLAAAGYGNGFSSTQFSDGDQTTLYPYATYTNVIPSMLSAAAINAPNKPLPYNSDFLPNIVGAYVNGNTKGFNGIAAKRNRGPATAMQAMYDMAHPSGRTFCGATPDGKNPQLGDQAITDLINQALQEFDSSKQEAIAKDYQRLMAEKAYLIQVQISSPALTLTWPALANYGTFNSPDAGVAVVEAGLQYWIDDTKPPLGKA